MTPNTEAHFIALWQQCAYRACCEACAREMTTPTRVRR